VSRRLRRGFFGRDPLEVAPDLLGMVLVAGQRSGRIVEVEAYRGADDPGSHGYRGITPRTEVMFGPPGHLYVYFSYGMHWCANVVCAPAGTCGAVLIRALAPLTGIEGMYGERGKARRDRDLCSGPAKLCQALQIDGSHNGLDLDLAARGVEFRDDGDTANAAVSTRIGLGPDKGRDLPWRFFVPGDPNVSASPR
jgi:DNA-3-methyladenine glycosylase